jgi:hypothetical protein
MVIYKADCLHVRIDNGATDEPTPRRLRSLENASLSGLSQSLGTESSIDSPSDDVDKPPYVTIERSVFFLRGEGALGH